MPGVGVGGAPGGHAGGDGYIILEYIADMSYATEPVEKSSRQMPLVGGHILQRVFTAQSNGPVLGSAPALTVHSLISQLFRSIYAHKISVEGAVVLVATGKTFLLSGGRAPPGPLLDTEEHLSESLLQRNIREPADHVVSYPISQPSFLFSRRTPHTHVAGHRGLMSASRISGSNRGMNDLTEIILIIFGCVIVLFLIVMFNLFVCYPRIIRTFFTSTPAAMTPETRSNKVAPFT